MARRKINPALEVPEQAPAAGRGKAAELQAAGRQAAARQVAARQVAARQVAAPENKRVGTAAPLAMACAQAVAL